MTVAASNPDSRNLAQRRTKKTQRKVGFNIFHGIVKNNKIDKNVESICVDTKMAEVTVGDFCFYENGYENRIPFMERKFGWIRV